MYQCWVKTTQHCSVCGNVVEWLVKAGKFKVFFTVTEEVVQWESEETRASEAGQKR